MEQKHKGAWAELQACCWLLSRGFEVFRNVSPHGGADIIAIKDGKVRKLDVKYSPNDAPIQLLEPQIRDGVEVFRVRENGKCTIEPGRIRIKKCVECGTDFRAIKHSQDYCSEECVDKKCDRLIADFDGI